MLPSWNLSCCLVGREHVPFVMLKAIFVSHLELLKVVWTIDLCVLESLRRRALGLAVLKTMKAAHT